MHGGENDQQINYNWPRFDCLPLLFGVLHLSFKFKSASLTWDLWVKALVESFFELWFYF